MLLLKLQKKVFLKCVRVMHVRLGAAWGEGRHLTSSLAQAHVGGSLPGGGAHRRPLSVVLKRRGRGGICRWCLGLFTRAHQ